MWAVTVVVSQWRPVAFVARFPGPPACVWEQVLSGSVCGATGYLEPVGAFAQLCLGPLDLSSSGQQLLQLRLHLLPSVFRFGPRLLQTLHLTRQVFVVTLQILDAFFQVAFELMQKRQAVRFFRRAPRCKLQMELSGDGLTLLACSSCSDSSSSTLLCLCLISWIWTLWFFISSSMAFFSSATSCSRLVLEKKRKSSLTYCLHIFCQVLNASVEAGHLSSCWAAVVSRVSSSSVFRASSSSLRSLLSFSALVRQIFSDSRSS